MTRLYSPAGNFVTIRIIRPAKRFPWLVPLLCIPLLIVICSPAGWAQDTFDTTPPPAVVATRPVVRGLVTDEQGPVAGATITVEVTDMAIRRVVFKTRGRTDLWGEYEIDLSPVDAYSLGVQVMAVDPEHMEGLKIEIVNKAALPIHIPIELKPGRSVSGHVYDDTGKPVAGAQVEVPYVRPVTSEFDGFYTVLGVPLSRSFSIVAKAEGFAPETRLVEPGHAGAVTDVDFKLKPERLVQGRVLDPEGGAVKGADVTIFLPLQRVWRKSDHKGEFEIRNLPYEASQAVVRASHPDFAPYEEKTVIREGNTSLTLELSRGGTLEGRVTAGPEARPVAGASIALSLPDARPSVVDLSGLDGSFHVRNIPEGEVVLTVFPPDESNLTRSGELLVEQTGDTLKGDVDPWPDNTASDFRGTVKGRAVRLERRDRPSGKKGEDDAPAVAVYTGALSENGLRMEGAFSLNHGGRKGTWEATRERKREDTLRGFWMWKETLEPPTIRLAPMHKSFHSTSGQTAREDVALESGWNLEGVVRDSQGQPVEGAEVILSHWDDRPFFFPPARSDAEGKFTLENLPAGKLQALARKQQVGMKRLILEKPAEGTKEPLEVALSWDEPSLGGGGPGTMEDLFAKSLKVGEQIPDFTVKTLDGSTIDSASLRGRIVLIDFTAAWCAPCIVEIPVLRRVHEKYGKRDDFFMFGVSFDFEEQDQRDLMKEYNIRWPMACDGKGWETDLGQKFGVMAIPRIYLIDKDGKVLRDDLRGEQMLQAVERALKGEPQEVERKRK